jgi:hypothetical protein
MSRTLTEDQAYAAMFAFLEDHFCRGPTDVIGTLLGALSILPSGRSADPAMQGDWAAAVDKAISGKVDLSLRLAGGDTKH